MRVRRERAILTMQRFLRGCRGRFRSARMRELRRSIDLLMKLCSIENFPPRLLDHLADEIESYKHRGNALSPAGLISLLRCIQCLFYADSPQKVTVLRYEKPSSVYLHASELGWEEAARVLRRKSVFIRKLRGLVGRLSPPNLMKLEVSAACIQLLEDLDKSISARDFDGMDTGRITALKLLEYVKHIKQILLGQKEFPEAFNSALPSWTIALRRHRLHYETSCSSVLSIQESIVHLSRQREQQYYEGVHFGLLAEAIQLQRAELKSALVKRAAIEKAFMTLCEELLSSVRRREESVMHELRAKHLAHEIAKRLYDEYLENSKVIVETHARKLGDDALQAQLTSLQADSSAELARFMVSMDIEYISSKNYLCYQLSTAPETISENDIFRSGLKEMGAVLGELRVLGLQWRDFKHNLGGRQYIMGNADEVESMEYQRMKTRSQQLLRRKSELLSNLNRAIEVNVGDLAEEFRGKRERLMTSYQLDPCTTQELEYEAKEDINCAVQESQNGGSLSGAVVNANQPSVPYAGHSRFSILIIADVKFIHKDTFSALTDFAITPIEVPTPAFQCIDMFTSQLVLNTLRLQGSAIIFLDLANVRRVMEKLLTALSVVKSELDPATKVTVINFTDGGIIPAAHPSDCVVTSLRSQLFALARVIDAHHFAEVLLSEAQAAVGCERPNFFSEIGAFISAVLGYWCPSPLDWLPQDVFKGCSELLSRIPKASLLSSALYSLDFCKWDYASYARLLPALKLPALSGEGSISDFPSLYWLSAWANKATELLNE